MNTRGFPDPGGPPNHLSPYILAICLPHCLPVHYCFVGLSFSRYRPSFDEGWENYPLETSDKDTEHAYDINDCSTTLSIRPTGTKRRKRSARDQRPRRPVPRLEFASHVKFSLPGRRPLQPVPVCAAPAPKSSCAGRLASLASQRQITLMGARGTPPAPTFQTSVELQLSDDLVNHHT